MSKQKECVKKMDKVIEELIEAKSNLVQSRFEHAENELIDALSECAKVLHCINEIERHEHEQHSPCDSVGAMPINNIVGSDGAPIGTANLIQGNKYITENGAIITWIDNTITVCEPTTPPDIWSVYGTPLTIKDVTGKVQQIPTPNAMIQLGDGSSLLVGSNGIGVITMSRFITNNSPMVSSTFQGYSINQTEVYMNYTDRSKVAQGTVAQIFGI